MVAAGIGASVSPQIFGSYSVCSSQCIETGVIGVAGVRNREAGSGIVGPGFKIAKHRLTDTDQAHIQRAAGARVGAARKALDFRA